MANDFVGIEVLNDKEIVAAIRKLPEEAQNAIMDDVNEYSLNVLRTYPPYKYASRKSVYGQTFQSDKQRKWFFAALDSGELQIPYRRTQTLRRGWRAVGSGPSSFIVNETPYADLTVGDGQGRMAKKTGWKKAIDTIQERILKVADAAVAKAQRKLGL
jgi:hypothetical protein